jgi:hypothetical protein
MKISILSILVTVTILLLPQQSYAGKPNFCEGTEKPPACTIKYEFDVTESEFNHLKFGRPWTDTYGTINSYANISAQTLALMKGMERYVGKN